MSASPTSPCYDTTLRDGAQGEGIHFSLADKLRIAQRLDAFGHALHRGGWPGSNEKDVDFFREAKSSNSSTHASPLRQHAPRPHAVENDPQVAMLLEAGTPVVTLVLQDLQAPCHRNFAHHPRRNLAHDPRHHLPSRQARARGHLRRRTHLDGYKEDPAYTTDCYRPPTKRARPTSSSATPTRLAPLRNRPRHGDLLSK